MPGPSCATTPIAPTRSRSASRRSSAWGRGWTYLPPPTPRTPRTPRTSTSEAAVRMATGGRRRERRGGFGPGHDEPVPGTAADLTPDADPESVARAIALRQLTAAPRTRAQLSDAMARRGVPDDVAEAVLDRFEEVRLVDDDDFARQWVQTRHAGRGLSRRALRHELRARGIDDEIVQEAVDQIDTEDELEAARQLVRRRL